MFYCKNVKWCACVPMLVLMGVVSWTVHVRADEKVFEDSARKVQRDPEDSPSDAAIPAPANSDAVEKSPETGIRLLEKSELSKLMVSSKAGNKPAREVKVVAKERAHYEQPSNAEVLSPIVKKVIRLSTESDAAGVAHDYSRLASLPPIEKLFNFPVPESVCDPDDRVQVTATADFPWSANCQLIITLSDGAGGRLTARGTGWLIGPKTVITAGHCVHGGAGDSYFLEVEVIPGMNRIQMPYGSQVSRKLRASKDWKVSGNAANDYGAILLDEEFSSSTGGSPGHLDVAVLSDAELEQLEVNISGYPGDKPTGTQWHAGGPLQRVSASRLSYMIDTYGGHSGSPIVRLLSDGSRHAIGIHNYGGCPNHCTRITASVQQDLVKWKAESEDADEASVGPGRPEKP